MPSISIYLTDEQQQKLDLLTKKGLAQDLLSKVTTKTKRSPSELIALLVEQEINKLEEAEMITDAVEIDKLQLGWNEEEEECQIIDMEQSGS